MNMTKILMNIKTKKNKHSNLVKRKIHWWKIMTSWYYVNYQKKNGNGKKNYTFLNFIPKNMERKKNKSTFFLLFFFSPYFWSITLGFSLFLTKSNTKKKKEKKKPCSSFKPSALSSFSTSIAFCSLLKIANPLLSSFFRPCSLLFANLL